MLVEALRVQPRGLNARHASYGAIIRCLPTGRILMVLGRAAGKWSLPKGHANTNESPFDCIVREIWEETGYRCTDIPIRSHRMKFGVYYEFHVNAEFRTDPQDTTEIAEARWFKPDEAVPLPMNSDTGAFIRSLATIPQKQTAQADSSLQVSCSV
jgi:8-oxo-dGTP pyrophosphatase MutT (NUDIX family)